MPAITPPPSTATAPETQQQVDAQQTQQPSYVTREDLESLINVIQQNTAKTVNAAITNRMKQLRSSATAATDGTPSLSGTDDTGTVAPETQTEAQRLQREVERLRRDVQLQQQKAQEAEAKRRADAVNSELMTSLTGKGLSPVRARAVLADWKVNGTLTQDEEGNYVLRVAKGKSAPMDYTDLSEGLKAWSETPEAAEFLPAVIPTGPSLGRAGFNTTANRKPTVDPIQQAAAEKLKKFLGG